MPGTLVSSGEGLWVVEAFLRGGGRRARGAALPGAGGGLPAGGCCSASPPGSGCAACPGRGPARSAVNSLEPGLRPGHAPSGASPARRPGREFSCALGSTDRPRCLPGLRPTPTVHFRGVSDPDTLNLGAR